MARYANSPRQYLFYLFPVLPAILDEGGVNEFTEPIRVFEASKFARSMTGHPRYPNYVFRFWTYLQVGQT